MVCWLRDCADPACIHMGVEHISSNHFKVDRMQIIVDVKKYIYVSLLFISRMPKMHAIPQLVLAPLNPIPIIAEHK